MKRLIVGLGNIGERYTETRHNVGFRVVDALAQRHGGTWKWKPFMKSDVSVVSDGSQTIWLAKPRTYMNRSGEAVQKLLRRFKPDEVVVVYDEADLSFGDVRVRTGGGSAGHNGVKSLVNHLGPDGFVRVRVGIGRPEHPNHPLDKWVLGKWSAEERKKLPELISTTIDALG